MKDVQEFFHSESLVFPEGITNELFNILKDCFQDKEDMIRLLKMELSRYKSTEEESE